MDQVFVRHDGEGLRARRFLGAAPWCEDEQDDDRHQTKHSTIARLGRFSTQIPQRAYGPSGVTLLVGGPGRSRVETSR